MSYSLLNALITVSLRTLTGKCYQCDLYATFHASLRHSRLIPKPMESTEDSADDTQMVGRNAAQMVDEKIRETRDGGRKDGENEGIEEGQ